MKIFTLIALCTGLIVNAEHVHAAPQAPASVARLQEHPSAITLVHRKNGSMGHSSAQQRTFRPDFVNRVRPLHHVRPERPFVDVQRKRLANPYLKRPPRPDFVQLGDGDYPVPETPLEVKPKRTVDEAWSSPDFCRYWGDRGEVSGYHDHCW